MDEAKDVEVAWNPVFVRCDGAHFVSHDEVNRCPICIEREKRKEAENKLGASLSLCELYRQRCMIADEKVAKRQSEINQLALNTKLVIKGLTEEVSHLRSQLMERNSQVH